MNTGSLAISCAGEPPSVLTTRLPSESAMPEPVTPAVAAHAATHLTNLQERLQDLGLHARLLTQDEQLPRLRVINPEATSLSEVISAAGKEGQWLFWWSWAEPIVAEPVKPGETSGYLCTLC